MTKAGGSLEADLPASRSRTTSDAPTLSGKARAVTTSAEHRSAARSHSRRSRRSRSSISAAGRAAISATFAALGHVADRSRRRDRGLPRWRARTAAARCGSRIFCGSTCPRGRFDGVFANAALFHVPRSELPRVLRELHAALRDRTACSSARIRTAANEEGWSREPLRRLSRSRNLASLLADAGFDQPRTIGRPACRASSSRGCDRVADLAANPSIRSDGESEDELCEPPFDLGRRLPVRLSKSRWLVP